jgi:GT2 family glycosyltransferase
MGDVATDSISAIVPTIGRPESLTQLLASLVAQSHRVFEVIVADAGNDHGTAEVAANPRWEANGLKVRRIPVSPPNAVRQRVAAIRESKGEFLLLLDDDVELEPNCVKALLSALQSDPEVVAATADFSNQAWPNPTRAWRIYLRYGLGMRAGSWQGRVVGPLLRFGYNPTPAAPQPMDWLGAGNSLIRRASYEQAGGFSDFFLHRCTVNEDIDLSLKLGRVGRILFCPGARMAHFHAPGGRVSASRVAEDDLYNRFMILRRTLGRSRTGAFTQIALFTTVETASQFLGSLKRLQSRGALSRFAGRIRALLRIMRLRKRSV